MLSVGVLYGGRSGEHDVSLCSAASVVSALDPRRFSVIAIGVARDGTWHVQDRPVVLDDPAFGRVMQLAKTGRWSVNHYEQGGRLCLCESVSGRTVSIDVVFPVLHGTFCEDGALQGLLELAMVPYVGADVLGSAIGMDKDVAKRLLRDAGIPVVPWFTVNRPAWTRNKSAALEAIADLGYPLFVKPANAGSSVGVRKIKTSDELEPGIDYALQYDDRVLVEKAVNARELECAVLGNHEALASVVGEVVPSHEFYSYEAKYIDPQGARLDIPARIGNELAEKIRDAAARAFAVLNCSGMARIDFFLERDGSEFYLNEINTLPGFTSISMYPKLMAATGMEYSGLLDRLIDLALERATAKKKLKREM